MTADQIRQRIEWLERQVSSAMDTISRDEAGFFEAIDRRGINPNSPLELNAGRCAVRILTRLARIRKLRDEYADQLHRDLGPEGAALLEEFDRTLAEPAG